MIEKRCPRCSQLVKAEAAACRHCQWNFSRSNTSVTKKGARTYFNGVSLGSRWWLLPLSAVALIFASNLANFSQTPSTSSLAADSAQLSDIPASEPPTEVSATDLANAFDMNEVRAMRDYGDRWLAVTGTLTGVDLDLTDDPVLKMESGQFLSVQAQFTKDDSAQLAALNKGEFNT